MLTEESAALSHVPWSKGGNVLIEPNGIWVTSDHSAKELEVILVVFERSKGKPARKKGRL